MCVFHTHIYDDDDDGGDDDDDDEYKYKMYTEMYAHDCICMCQGPMYV